VSRRITVPIAGRSSCAGLADAPNRGMPIAHPPRQEQRVGLGRRTQALHLGIADAEQRPARQFCVHHRAAEKSTSNLPKSAGEPRSAVTPNSASRAVMLIEQSRWRLVR
jgi:hypothetical protein